VISHKPLLPTAIQYVEMVSLPALKNVIMDSLTTHRQLNSMVATPAALYFKGSYVFIVMRYPPAPLSVEIL
jgi:hypothetical protein